MNIIIRKEKDLILFLNTEGVYFLTQFGQIIDNGFNYDILSDKFNEMKG